MADNLKDFIEPIAIKGPNEMKKGLERAYFPELDSLRFFAFLMVFGFHHGLPNLGSWIRDILAMTIDLPILILFGTGGIGNRLGPAVDHALSRNGWIGVNLFFTLSGFIITRLLLREELQYGRIDWSAFWVRRILRIWPLYYLIFLIGFLGLPFTDRIHGIGLGSPQMPWFGLFLGNWSMIHFGPIGSDILSILWSVCVEEQFYIFIPIVIAILGTRGRWIFSITGILIAILQRISLAKSGVQQYQITYNSVAQMDSILAGVLLALALNHEPFRNTIVHLTRKYLVWLILPVTLFLITRNHLGHEIVLRQVVDPVAIWLVALVWIMVAAAGSPRFSRILSWPAFVGAGKISYGLYMWHEILLSLFGSGFMTLAAVILTAWLSYEFLEKPVLRYKRRWSRVESRPV
jgi:peptidoglycan/LPS O-acetylase OafA/YrhL